MSSRESRILTWLNRIPCNQLLRGPAIQAPRLGWTCSKLIRKVGGIAACLLFMRNTWKQMRSPQLGSSAWLPAIGLHGLKVVMVAKKGKTGQESSPMAQELPAGRARSLLVVMGLATAYRNVSPNLKLTNRMIIRSVEELWHKEAKFTPWEPPGAARHESLASRISDKTVPWEYQTPHQALQCTWQEATYRKLAFNQNWAL